MKVSVDKKSLAKALHLTKIKSEKEVIEKALKILIGFEMPKDVCNLFKG